MIVSPDLSLDHSDIGDIGLVEERAAIRVAFLEQLAYLLCSYMISAISTSALGSAYPIFISHVHIRYLRAMGLITISLRNAMTPQV